MQTVTAIAGTIDFETTLRIGAHTLTVDAPASLGGLDKGPEPHDLLAASLASCTTMTLQMYAKRKGWNVAGLRVDVTPSKDAAGTTTFARTLAFGAELDADQRTRLAQIANACPVHKILSGTIRIETTTA